MIECEYIFAHDEREGYAEIMILCDDENVVRMIAIYGLYNYELN
jgi:hypothetical protein